VVTLTVEADDEHGAAVPITRGLAWRWIGSFSSLWRNVTHALTEAAMTKFVGAAKEFDGIVGIVRS
jgi:orotate phosphoribosyltransferase-like protein